MEVLPTVRACFTIRLLAGQRWRNGLADAERSTAAPAPRDAVGDGGSTVRMIRSQRLALFFAFSSVTLAACSGGTNVQVSWTANRETAVNNQGGGYKVYYSKTSGFDISTASSLDVSFKSAPAAPTSATLQNVSSGTYYVKVVAYSAIIGPGGRASTSAPSVEVSVVVQ